MLIGGCFMSRRHRKKGKHHRAPFIKANVREAAGQIDELRDLASDHEITVQLSEVWARRRNVVTYHFIFRDKDGFELLQYWPGSGRIWSKVTGLRASVKDAWDALEEAARISCRSWEESEPGRKT